MDETPAFAALYGWMLSQGQPGLLAAVLIALAGGWVASRLLRAALAPFPSLIVGICGAVLGILLLGALGLPLDGLWLLASSVAGGVVLLATSKASQRVAERWRNRNRFTVSEFDERGSTGSQEEPYGLDSRHHYRHHRRVARREDHAP